MKERIEIENFGCIDYLNIEINKINIFIGPQAAGKSLTAKLLYYFKSIFSEVRRIGDFELTISEFEDFLRRKFLTYFPKESWENKHFSIRYYFGKVLVEINYSAKLQVICSPDLKDIFKLYKFLYNQSLKGIETDDVGHFERSEVDVYHQFIDKIQGKYGIPFAFKQIFVPAGRSFFASVKSSVFTMLSENSDLDPFLVEFGSYYETTKRLYRNRKRISLEEFGIMNELINEILHGSYVRFRGEDYLVHPDNRKIKLNIASSGQQEVLPLALILSRIALSVFANNGATVYIEEPEAHLYPESQKTIVELIAAVANIARLPLQFVITTHSPYILSAFNNLLEAGNIIEDCPRKAKEVNRIIDERKILKFEHINAFSLEKGSYKDILDYEMQLISPTILDNVSNDISIEFGKLLDL